MSDYIDRTKLTARLIKQYRQMNRRLSLLAVTQTIAEMPHEYVYPVKLGSWIGDIKTGARCSVCDTVFCLVGENEERAYSCGFCPRCGARMV